jgi:pilus assembly protein Flp/PilA
MEFVMFNLISRFVKEDSGATAIEYALIAALVSVAAVGALTVMGQTLNTIFGAASSALNTAVSGG